MPRRSDHSRDEFIDLVVSAAEALIADAGEAGLSARAIARRIGYSPGSLYLAFADRDDILLHVNARTLDRLYRQIAAGLEGNRPPLEQLKRAARDYVAFARANPQLWRLCFEHRLPDDRPGPAWLDARIQALVELILTPLGQASGARGDALVETAQALWAGVHGVCILTLTRKLHLVGRQSTEHLTDALVTHYLRGAAVANT